MVADSMYFYEAFGFVRELKVGGTRQGWSGRPLRIGTPLHMDSRADSRLPDYITC